MSNISKFDDFIKNKKNMAAKIYHLSYDRKNEEDYLEEIAELIKNDLKAKWCKRLVESSLVFATTKNFKDVFEALKSNFSKDIFFVLTQTPLLIGEDDYRMSYDFGNDESDENFQEIWEDI